MLAAAHMTRAAMAAHLATLGVVGAAADALLRETAPARHAARVEAALAAARAYDEFERGDAIALAILLADAMGVGGRDGVEGAATLRHPALRSLGSGRKQATDGPAWSAAIAEALARLANEMGPVSITPHSGMLTLWGGADGGWVLGLAPEDATVPAEWRRTIIREGLRRAAGLAGWFRDLPVEFPGSAADWAALLDSPAQDLCPKCDAEDCGVNATFVADEGAHGKVYSCAPHVYAAYWDAPELEFVALGEPAPTATPSAPCSHPTCAAAART
jgi:hypothetical protein